MTRRAAETVDRARSLIGTRFRLQGRGRDGIDCVGVAAFALDLPDGSIPRDYGLRGTAPERIVATLQSLGLRAAGDRAAGDISLHVSGPEQLHLGVVTGDGFVHADSGLGRVVERPWPPPWPAIGFWRLIESE